MRQALHWATSLLVPVLLSFPPVACAAQSGDFTWTVRLCARQSRCCSDAAPQGEDWKQLLMAIAPSVLPVAGVVFALNLFTATSRAELAGLKESTAANLAGLKESTAASIAGLKESTVALKESTAASLAGLKESTVALKESTAASIAGLKESTDAKITASNQILAGYTSILDRMSKDLSSKQQ